MATANSKQNQKSSIPYYSKDLNVIYSELKTDPEIGLDEEVVSSRLIEHGPNELPKVKSTIWKIYLAPIFNLFILILIIMVIPIIIWGSFGDAILTFGVIVLNAIIAVWQQFKAQKTLKSLLKLQALKGTVIRGGVKKEIDTTELVPGDIIDLKQGVKIPADSRIITSANLEVNEAALTGESAAVPKSELKLSAKIEIPIQEQINMVFQGSFVTRGKARAIVVYTGVNTEIGNISTELNKGGVPEIPLTAKMNSLAKKLSIGVIIMVAVSFLFRLFTTGDPITDAFVGAIAVGKNLVPINLPLMTTLVMITGVLTLAQQGVIIRNLAAIESFGRVSIIASDKTGTITKNEMTVKLIWYDDKIINVPEVEYPNKTPLHLDQSVYNFSDDPYFELFIHSQVINNSTELIFEQRKIAGKGRKEKEVRSIIGAPTEGALLTLSENIGYDIDQLRKRFEILHEFPFDSSVKRMSTVVNDKDGIKYAFIKGASEIIIDRSTSIVLDGKIQDLTKKFQAKLLEDVEAAAKAGFRTLSIAYKPLEDFNRENPNRDQVEQDLIFLGFVSILDPPRDGVKESVISCHQAGVAVKMITGDHPVTARTIAMDVGIFGEGDKVIEGKNIDSLTNEEFRKAAVFARVTPQDKVKIVKRYQDVENRLVAMTGDGVNDAIALKQAHTGIAMGIAGSDVAKEAADMVITDDDFNSIVRGLRVGRGIFHRIRVIIFFFIALNLMEAIIFFGFRFAPVEGFEMFSILQHTYLFAIVHAFPSLALIPDPYPKGIMKEPPRDSEELVSRPLFKLMLVQCLCVGVGIALAYLIPLWGLAPFDSINASGFIDPLAYEAVIDGGLPFGELQLKARTMCMTVIFVSELLVVWSMRRPNASFKQSLIKEFNWLLMASVGLCLFIHIGLMYFGPDANPVVFDILGENIGWIALNGFDWLWVILLSSTGIIGLELYKWNARRNGKYF